MGGMYQDAAEGRGAGSGMRENSQPTRCHWAAANALLISAVEKIPPHPKSTSVHSCLCQPARTLTQTHDWCMVWFRISVIFIFGEA